MKLSCISVLYFRISFGVPGRHRPASTTASRVASARLSEIGLCTIRYDIKQGLISVSLKIKNFTIISPCLGLVSKALSISRLVSVSPVSRQMHIGLVLSHFPS